jgi:hypothetical protein
VGAKGLFQLLILLVALVIVRPLNAQGQGATPQSGLPEVTTFGNGASQLERSAPRKRPPRTRLTWGRCWTPLFGPAFVASRSRP